MTSLPAPYGPVPAGGSAGAGLAALRLPARIAALALVAALVAPTQLAFRAPGGGMDAVARFVGPH